MAKLTFVDGDITTGGGFTMNSNAAFNGGTVGNIGCWMLEAGAGMTAAPDHIAGAATEFFLDNTGGQTDNTIWPHKFQFTQQTTGGYPYATGIIERERVKRIDYTAYTAGAKATTGAVTITSAGVNNSEFRLTIVKLSGYSDYAEFLNPSGSYDDRVGQVRSYTYQSDASQTAIELADGIADAINADLGSFVSCTHTPGTAVITIVAKDNGTGFRIMDNSATAIAPTTLVGAFGCTEGSGNGYQAIEAEKKSLHHRGAHHNRTWLADTIEQFAVAAGTYDIFTITCDHGVGGQTGANWKDDLVVELWIDSNFTTAGVLDDFWAVTPNTSEVLYVQS